MQVLPLAYYEVVRKRWNFGRIFATLNKENYTKLSLKTEKETAANQRRYHGIRKASRRPFCEFLERIQQFRKTFVLVVRTDE